jgi:adenosine/AMP kinase
MGWKWDAAKAHNVQVTVAPAGTDESTVGIVWGDKPAETKTVKNADAEKLLHQLAQQVQQLGYMM